MAHYPVPTLDETHRRLLAVRGSLMPGADLTVGGVFWRNDRVTAAGITDVHAHIDAVGRDSNPLTAGEAALLAWGALVDVPRKPATPARKARALQIQGTPGALLPAGAELVHTSGLRVHTTAPVAVGPDGFAIADVTAVDTGARTRFPAGTSLRFVAPPQGIQQAAQLVRSMDEDGEDAESLGAYRARVVNHFREPPQGGNRNDYAQWALRVPGVSAAYVYPRRAGLGTVDLAALHTGSGSARALTAAERAALFAFIDARRPVTDVFRVLEVVVQPVHVEVAIAQVLDPAYDFDWDDTYPPVVDSYDPATRTITTFEPLPPSLAAGKRFCLRSPGPIGGPVGDDDRAGAQHQIEALVAADAFRVVPDPELALSPASGDVIYAGGPLVAAVRAAILRHLDNLGTANPLDNGTPRYGTWIGSVDPARLQAIAYQQDGVSTARVLAPADLVDADDPPVPDDHRVGLLVPGRVLVRRDA